MEMRQQPVDAGQHGAAEQKAHGNRQPIGRTAFFGHGNCRRQQRPVGGGDHDAGGEAHHDVKDFLVGRSEEKDHCGTQGSHAPGKSGGQQSEQQDPQ